ncbi:MAG: DNA/RNA nuclease SfsA [Rhizobiales bacterium]|nr:DNA/RNA nuclease SfsA [Hyphomicrobiales bacterium]MBO6697799.1 DNA/RNA nuclease SfsA [Hyphomicrobiales bacterium]MBO6735946.1 DNA/RNA nuclease SfsA [Hyphomicrobiales bacterium]MBO6912416.1 DNA/RNA nuclease SfsA [Hyphomicrobiales bacterium]MBO6955046.1 DNA/RNA nuclease SfsA [Hyphomicrobiales bacterium]
MQFPTPLFEARLIKRYKRFLADVEMLEGPDAGQMLTVHCPNPGSMMGLARPGAQLFVSRSPNPKRKLAYTYELEQVDGPGAPCLVGINTMLPNKLAEEAIIDGLIPELAVFDRLKREQKYGETSRIDILLEFDNAPLTYVEVKNVHLMRQASHLEFPDSVTARGAKHLAELSAMVAAGHRAVMLFVAQWPGGKTMSVAADIDPTYAAALSAAMNAGVEVLALDCAVAREGITPCGMLDFVPG